MEKKLIWRDSSLSQCKNRVAQNAICRWQIPNQEKGVGFFIFCCNGTVAAVSAATPALWRFEKAHRDKRTLDK